ncbi:hypothetical protein AGR6A_pb0091 [Agrobacterium sp. NCPPB 925]|nr:hypothetical protein AGR6A_pb0091 [Agrobacterium sp. NCPPB 925]
MAEMTGFSAETAVMSKLSALTRRQHFVSALHFVGRPDASPRHDSPYSGPLFNEREFCTALTHGFR